MTTVEMTTSEGGGQDSVVRDNALRNRRNDHLTTSPPHSPILPHSSRVGGSRGGQEVVEVVTAFAKVEAGRQ